MGLSARALLRQRLIDGQSRALIDRIAPWGERSSNIVRALPYNAAAKPIESIFKVLEQNHFRFNPGWIGGDRMRKKTENVGKEPPPFPSAVEDLRAALQAALDFYHATPSDPRSALKGLSPNAAFAQAVGEASAPLNGCGAAEGGRKHSPVISLPCGPLSRANFLGRRRLRKAIIRPRAGFPTARRSPCPQDRI